MSDVPMDEFAAMTAMWIAFHEARPDVSLTWFIQHYPDGAIARLTAERDEWVAKYADAFTSPPRVAERALEQAEADLAALRARVEEAVTYIIVWKEGWSAFDGFHAALAILAPPEGPQ